MSKTDEPRPATFTPIVEVTLHLAISTAAVLVHASRNQSIPHGSSTRKLYSRFCYSFHILHTITNRHAVYHNPLQAVVHQLSPHHRLYDRRGHCTASPSTCTDTNESVCILSRWKVGICNVTASFYMYSTDILPIDDGGMHVHRPIREEKPGAYSGQRVPFH